MKKKSSLTRKELFWALVLALVPLIIAISFIKKVFTNQFAVRTPSSFYHDYPQTQPTPLLPSPSPPLVSSLSQTGFTLPAPKPGWQIYLDPQLGFYLQYPTNWYDFGQSGSFKGRCFGAYPEEQRNPRFCVDFDPSYVLPHTGSLTTAKDQQLFFEKLIGSEIGQRSVAGLNQYTVRQFSEVAGYSAVERIETHLPEAEGIEKAYTVAVYLYPPQVGLIRLSMHALDEKQFQQHETTLRQILTSFSFFPTVQAGGKSPSADWRESPLPIPTFFIPQ